MTARIIPALLTWGERVRQEVSTLDGGLNRVVEGVHGLLGAFVGSRAAFSKLLTVTEPQSLDEVDAFRAWLLLTFLKLRPAEYGIDDEAVPRHFDVERLREDLYTTRDSNPEPAD